MIKSNIFFCQLPVTIAVVGYSQMAFCGNQSISFRLKLSFVKFHKFIFKPRMWEIILKIYFNSNLRKFCWQHDESAESRHLTLSNL